MKTNEIIARSWKFAAPYGVVDGKKFRLKDADPNDTSGSFPMPNREQKKSSKEASKHSLNYRTCFTRKISLRYWQSFNQWMPRKSGT